MRSTSFQKKWGDSPGKAPSPLFFFNLRAVSLRRLIRLGPHQPRDHFVKRAPEDRHALRSGRNKVAVAIPLSEIGEHLCDEGTYRLFLKSGGKAVVQESTSVRNFYPGFYCMAGLIGATTR